MNSFRGRSSGADAMLLQSLTATPPIVSAIDDFAQIVAKRFAGRALIRLERKRSHAWVTSDRIAPSPEE